jgi:hypothetical protein
LYPWFVPRQPDGRYAERTLDGFDDAGARERIVIWIERKDGGVWAVGRVVNPQYRESAVPRRDDYVFEGYELDDALEQANSTLQADLTVSPVEGILPFEREEVLKRLEAWFFGRAER